MHDSLIMYFNSELELVDFCEWFKKEGFIHFEKSNDNGKNGLTATNVSLEYPNPKSEEYFEDTPTIEIL